MKKSELIAHCLVEAKIVETVEGGLGIFERVWRDYFSELNLARWDSQVPDYLEAQLLKIARGSARINVKRLIEDLTE